MCSDIQCKGCFESFNKIYTYPLKTSTSLSSICGADVLSVEEKNNDNRKNVSKLELWGTKCNLFLRAKFCDSWKKDKLSWKDRRFQAKSEQKSIR